ncbi:MAG TPA: patatin-like phospholipase family protein [Candidatus Polarisedimenticolia bacterium]|nr:patatin-like phospholipase family protein [Candidatus Polarisedimenticolia bacterium]
MFEGFKVGLALGGGAARGLAHIGILKVLEQESIPIDLIVGTSVGALVGGVYATTRSAAATERRFLDFIFSKQFKRSKFDFLKETREAHPGLFYNFISLVKKGIFYSFSMAKRSWISAEQFEHNINGVLDDVAIEQTTIPFAAVAADILKGEEVVLRNGSLRRAVSASSAVPGLLPPVALDGRMLIDGGWVTKVPVLPALKLGADLVIAVDVSKDIEDTSGFKNGLNIMVRANAIKAEALKAMQCRFADVLIEPEVGHIHWADFSAVVETVRLGEEATRRKIGSIRRHIRMARWAALLGVSRTRRLARAYIEKPDYEKVS